MLAAPQEDVVRLARVLGGPPASRRSSSTPPTTLDAWTGLVARSLLAAGMRRHDVFQNMMTYGLFTGGLGLH